ncbi:Ornithine/DAP/Arg decarboxylase [Corchorus olitorius]|uniref:Arginine decarboxylase n=1 Tax=Corchorus olitorius TaxID=93759 RepID=A0A1R3J1B9_9ROSI|nr:Ornithine/DAP/Arg decarboxylase [Corchorus olitorius]
MDCFLHWSPSLSSLLYKIEKWGAPYFSVNSSGNISIRPKGLNTTSSTDQKEIDLLNVVKKVSADKSSGGLGLQLPLIIRLPDILKHRLESLQSAFESSISTCNYRSHYQGVYPVKSNQDRFIVEDIVRFEYPFKFGLEVGSKPELLLAMTCLCKGHPEALLICNGFKDKDYILLALIARKLAFNVVIVLEQVEELDLVIDLSKKLNISPVIGLRAKLRTKHDGHFGSTSGERGKFGLTPRQILGVVKKLEKEEMLNCLSLLHFHIGSQIPSITLLSDGIVEATQIYCELVRLGACMQFLDVGGGLGIDYDGSKSKNSDFSIGYDLQEYASTIVQVIQQVCDSKSVKHPVICSESGRAIVSHHSILIFEAISSSASDSDSPGLNPEGLEHLIEGLTENARYGKIDRFIGGESGLALHELRGNENQYYLGMFLAGAYEEALGGSHNLLGNPSVVQVTSESSEAEGFAVTIAMPGQSCRDVLRTMQYDPDVMFEELKQRIEGFGRLQVNGITDGMLQSVLEDIFNNMPYLMKGSSSCSLV